MKNTKTQLGAAFRTDAFCRSIFVSLHLICLNHQKDSYCVLLAVTQSCEGHNSVDIQYTKSQNGTEHLKHATDLPMEATINHAKSSACSPTLVLMSGPLNSSYTQISINISAVVYGT